LPLPDGKSPASDRLASDNQPTGLKRGGIQLDGKIRMGALISGGGTNLQAIIDACRSGRIDGRMVFVGSDNPGAGGLDRARRDNIPTFVVDYNSVIRQTRAEPENVELPDDFDLDDLLAKQNFFDARADPARAKFFLISRALAEAKLLQAMRAYPFDLLVLAGFMRNLTPYFIDRVNLDRGRPRIMNIHPALLPAFAGTDGYGDTFRYGCKVGGCTVHFIDYGEDTGPIIGQRAFQIQPEDTIHSIRKKGLKLEWDLYPACIQLFARRQIKLVNTSLELKGGKKIQKTVVKIVAAPHG
jgi:phosphoribosylglycinamide formyltransferase-1